MRKPAVNHLQQRRGSRVRQRGFTLLEVMVAMAIIAFALPALMGRMSSMAGTASHARDLMIAHWVAENIVQEIYLNQRLRNIIPTGRQADDTEMAGIVWDWQTESESIEYPPGAMRLFVRVRRQGSEQNLIELTMVMPEP